MGQKGEAFVKGGCGCLIAFLLLGFCAVLIGGTLQIDVGGAILLFVIGGLVGLGVLAIYNKGVRAGRDDREPMQDLDSFDDH